MIEIIRNSELDVADQVFLDAAASCLSVAGIKAACSFNLWLTDETGIKDVNRSWRGKDAVTDVLSFPSLNVHPGRLFDPDAEAALSVWDCDHAAFFLGDVMLCTQQTIRQAEQFGHSLKREASYLMVHGLLHLLGYDHVTVEDQQKMREQEEKTLQMTDKTKLRDQELLQAARQARQMAYVPYSKFRVGAALLGANGKVYTGCNVENASFGLTNCAERTAIFKAVSEGCQQFEAVAIAADQTAPWPCGACRQVLSEFAPALRVLVTWGEDQVEETTLEHLLPHSFLGFEEDAHG